MSDVHDAIARLKEIAAFLDDAPYSADGVTRTRLLTGLCHLQLAIDTFEGSQVVAGGQSA